MGDPPAVKRREGTTPLQKALLLLLGFGLIFCLEGALQLLGIGGESSLFVGEEGPDGEEYFVTNGALNRRLFFPVTGKEGDFPRPQIPYARFPARKAPHTFRFFVVGASSSVAFPFAPNIAFASYLREMITATLPGAKVEGINASMTAVSSYQVARWVGEILKKYDPDLIVVYTGHNEFYGVLGAGSAMSVGANRTLTRLFLKLQNTAIYAAMARAVERLARPRGDRPKGQLLDALTRDREVRPGSELHTSVEKNYRENLEEMARGAERRNVTILFCTPVSNRSGCSPMVSLHRPGFPDDLQQEWLRRLQFGETRARAGDWKRAGEEYARALAVDSAYAELHYRIGILRLNEGSVEEARRAFSTALLYDALHLRACDPLVDVVREVCAGRAKKGIVHLVDVVRRFDEASEKGVTGSDLLLEHIHPNARGHYLIASEICRVLARSGLPELSGEELSFAEACRRVGYSPVDRAYAASFMCIMLRQWPFKGTYRNSDAIRKMEGELSRSREAMTDVERKVFDSNPVGATVLRLHHRLGLAYLEEGLPGKAAEEFGLLVGMLPDLLDVQILLARSLFLSGRFEEAKRPARTASLLAPDDPLPPLILARILRLSERDKDAGSSSGEAVKQGYRGRNVDVDRNGSAPLPEDPRFPELFH